MAVLKAFNGDRSKNLDAIASEIELLLRARRMVSVYNVIMPFYSIRKILGYCEQLKIIAAELRKQEIGS